MLRALRKAQRVEIQVLDPVLLAAALRELADRVERGEVIVEGYDYRQYHTLGDTWSLRLVEANR